MPECSVVERLKTMQHIAVDVDKFIVVSNQKNAYNIGYTRNDEGGDNAIHTK